MKKYLLVMALPILMQLTACKDNKTETTKESITEQPGQAAGSITSAPGGTNSRWEARRAKGDTLAMPYKDLQQYLPEIDGYTRDGNPRGSQINMPGMGSWSETEQEYTSGDKTITVKIVDYNAAWQTFEGVTSLYRMAFSSEDDYKKQQAVDLGMKDAFGYETIYKQDKRAELVLIVADRFFITIETEGEGSESHIRNIAKEMDLQKLASK